MEHNLHKSTFLSCRIAQSAVATSKLILLHVRYVDNIDISYSLASAAAAVTAAD